MLRILRILWPALLPLILHAAYALWRGARLRAGKPVPSIPGLWFYTLLSSLLIGIALFLVLGFQQEPRHATHYQPTELNADGTLTRERMQ